MLLFVCSEAVASKLVKLETSLRVILTPMVTVLWIHYTTFYHLQLKVPYHFIYPGFDPPT